MNKLLIKCVLPLLTFVHKSPQLFFIIADTITGYETTDRNHDLHKPCDS